MFKGSSHGVKSASAMSRDAKKRFRKNEKKRQKKAIYPRSFFRGKTILKEAIKNLANLPESKQNDYKESKIKVNDGSIIAKKIRSWGYEMSALRCFCQKWEFKKNFLELLLEEQKRLRYLDFLYPNGISQEAMIKAAFCQQDWNALRHIIRFHLEDLGEIDWQNEPSWTPFYEGAIERYCNVLSDQAAVALDLGSMDTLLVLAKQTKHPHKEDWNKLDQVLASGSAEQISQHVDAMMIEEDSHRKNFCNFLKSFKQGLKELRAPPQTIKKSTIPLWEVISSETSCVATVLVREP